MFVTGYRFPCASLDIGCFVPISESGTVCSHIDVLQVSVSNDLVLHVAWVGGCFVPT